MTILFGHPTGNPNSHHAALAHFEAGCLEAFCVPWFPSRTALRAIGLTPGLAPLAGRLSHRRFEPLAAAPKIQGRAQEWRRLLVRALGRGSEGLSYEANDWLMHVMSRGCRRAAVTAVHAYEDCSLAQFETARRLGKRTIYDLPIGYYPAWEATQQFLANRYAEWIPAGGLESSAFVRPDQKRREMELADLVLVPSQFVADTVRRSYPDKAISLARYGVDAEAWFPAAFERTGELVRFLFVGQCSIRKGVPLLLETWRKMAPRAANLHLVGTWALAQEKLSNLPPRVSWEGPIGRSELRSRFHSSDVLVLPTYFEGRALVIGEALACGLAVLTTPASGAEDLVDASCGRIVPVGDEEALGDGLRWFNEHADRLPGMRVEARTRASRATWGAYRAAVSAAAAGGS